MTEDLEPDDIDIVLAIHLAEWENCEAEPKMYIDALQNMNLKPQLGCHTNFWILFPEGHPMYWDGVWSMAYWIRQWGFGRSEQRKGVAEVELQTVLVSV